MNRAELRAASEAIIRATLRRHLPAGTQVYLYGSRARGNAAWHSDYDLWIDADLPERVIADIRDAIDASIVPFRVDLVTTPQLRGRFGERVRSEARPWP
jgi:predicted nucleotidyltransferase